ncbi:MAG: CHASE3 domain-containing protein [Bacteroidota bacterium]|nr:CHASE3 domain-containing protein [Bacteroidota bacterium]
MKNHLRKKLFFLSLIILSGILLVGVADYKSNQKLLDSAQRVQHSERVIYQSDNIYSLSKDIEILTQGCIITNDSAALEPRVFPKTIFAYIGELRRLTVDNPGQQQLIDSLTLYMFKYLNFSYQTVELRNREGLVKAIAFIATKEGKRYTDRINEIVRAIQQEESMLLAQRTKINEGRVAIFKRFSVIMLVLLALMTALLLIITGKYFLQRKEKALSTAQLVKTGLEHIKSEKRLARAQQVAHMGSWQLNSIDNMVLYSDEACSIYGIPVEQNRMSFAEWISFIHPEDIHFVLEKIKESRESLQDLSFYYRIVHRNGTVRHIYLESKPELDSDAKATTFYGIMHDVTEIKLAEEKIEFDRNNLAALINNTGDMIWSIDTDLRVIAFNEAFNQDILLTTGKPLLKEDPILESYVNENRLNTFKILYSKALKGESFTILDRLDYPAEIWSEVSFYPLRKGGAIIGTACFSRDVTQRTQNERVLRAMEQELLDQKIQEQKKITRAILTAQERERNHIGQELHDNICQILVSSRLFFSSAVNENEALKGLIKYPMELIDSSIEEIRRLSSRQVTPIKDVDLHELVESILDSLRQNTMIDTTLQYEVDNLGLSDDLKLNVYRIIQEQINNIVKHASPGKVAISLRTERNELHIDMKDDGKGFDMKKKRKGIGISNMMNRIESFNGQMVMESSPGNGCSVHIDIPY